MATCLVACTTATEPRAAQSPVDLCCGYVGNDWQSEGLAWAAGSALRGVCACPGAHGLFSARLVIDARGVLESLELQARSGDAEADRCVGAAIESAVRGYLAQRPGAYALPRLGDSESVGHGYEYAMLKCEDAARYAATMPDAFAAWRFALRRMKEPTPRCHRDPETMSAVVSFDLR